MDSLDGLGRLYFHKYILLFAQPPLPLYSLSILFLMQPSGGVKQNEEGGLWFHQWTMQAGIKKEEE